MSEGLKLLWTQRALDDLRRVAERSPQRARAVVEAMEFMSELGWSLGHPVTVGRRRARYWPVPPLGVYYTVRGNVLSVGGWSMRDGFGGLRPDAASRLV